MMEFWAKPGSWPMDAAGYAFLARAVQELGRAIHGEEWSGAEIVAPVEQSLPANQPIGPRHLKDHAVSLLRIHDPKIAPPPTQVPTTPHAALHGPSLSDAQWAAAVAISKKRVAEAWPPLNRLHAVKVEIVKRCEAGDLHSFTRSKGSGEMMPIPRASWRTEQWRQRFTICQMNRADPFSPGFGGERYEYIFVGRPSLDALIATLSGAPVDPAGPWRRGAERGAEAWCVTEEAVSEARRRASLATLGPSDRDLCRAMVVMWRDATGETLGWKTFEQYRVRHRALER